METKFNFNSQVCTSRSQSERLLALGLKKETADCVLPKKDNLPPLVMPYDKASIYTTLEFIPAWSLGRLWELLDKIKKYEGEDELSYPRISLVEEDVIVENPKSLWV